MRDIKLSFLLVGFILLIPLCNVALNTSRGTARIAHWSSDFRPYGAYVDELRFMIFGEPEIVQASIALWTGEIDALHDEVWWDYQGGPPPNPDVTYEFSPNLRYRVLTLNCEKFPANITAFRRAMAFGFDKYKANQECIGGIGQPLDSHIPIAATEWEVESQMTEHFFAADYVSGNKSLENAGFKDLDGDGWREYDKNDNGVWDPGVDLDDDGYTEGFMVIEFFATAGYDPAIIACQIAQQGLEAMGVRSIVVEMDPNVFFTSIFEGSVQVFCWTEGISTVNTPKILYDNFRTGGQYNKAPYNYYHFSNGTIDAVLDTVMNAATLEEAKAATMEALNLLAFEQPQIVCYNEALINGYRTDKFDGFFEFKGNGYTGKNPYCATKVHLKDSIGGPLGGTFKISKSGDLETTNILMVSEVFTKMVMGYIYEKLWQVDPLTWDPIPGLAYDWDIEQTTANGDIRDGQKFSFYLYENETWHDGEPFTAADVNHSLHLWRDSWYNPPEMWDIYKVEIPDDYTIELYVNETSYFEWADTTAFYIIPEHIWRDVQNVTAYSPTIAEVIGTGPYKLDSWVPGEFISLLRHENWRWDIREDPVLTTSTISTDSKTSSTTLPTSLSSIHSSDSSTQPSLTSLPIGLPILQIFDLSSVLFFVLALVIIVRRQRMD